jgi:hypothetical protein
VIGTKRLAIHLMRKHDQFVGIHSPVELD